MRRRRLEDQLNCLGYFGFGSGYGRLLGLTGADGSMYCNQCPKAAACWQQHRERVRALLPDLCQMLDDLVAKHKGNGPAAVKEMIQRVGVEPYSSLMLGNTEDGSRVQAGLAPKDRGPFTITYPFTKKKE